MNNADTFIAVSEDCPNSGAVPPPGRRSIAEIQSAMLVGEPYRHTEEDVLFASSAAMRENPDRPATEKSDLREAFFSRSQACLRTSPLAKKWGWGIHFDHNGKAAAFAKGSEDYRRLSEDDSLAQAKGMRSKRATGSAE